jgi:hypothetical protein
MQVSGVATKVLGGVVAFCALAFAPIPAASAGCGDYLTMDHGPKDAASTPSGHVPCNGPNCHRGEVPPLTPAPTLPAVPPSIDVAWLTSDSDRDPRSLGERLTDSDLRPSPGYESSILRPPRSV